VSGVFEASVERLADQLAYPADDPRLEMLDLARRLAVLCDLDAGFAESSPTGHYLPVREHLRACVEWAGEDPNYPPGTLDVIRLRRLRRFVGPMVGDPPEPPTGGV
jgi:hypothetical protein